MKKIIAVFAMMLAFGYTANAQQKKVATPAKQQQETVDKAAIDKAVMKDMELITTNMELSEDELSYIKALIVHKQQVLATKDLSQERKDILAENIESKLRSGLPKSQVGKLDEDPQLLYKLTH
jgi:hypothetical protein